MDHATIERRGDVAVVALDRPPANAMDPGLLDDVSSACDAPPPTASAPLLRDDVSSAAEALTAEAPGAIVLTGRPGFFSAGADLKLVPTLHAAGHKPIGDCSHRTCTH